MAGYTAGSDQLKQAGKEMESGNAELQGSLAALASTVEGIAGSWSGQAHTAFQTLMHRFADDAKELNNALNSIAEQIAGSATEYEAQEAQAQESISKITGALGG